MGYTTDFYGEFAVTPTLKPEHREYLTAFANTRRVTRNEVLAEKLADPVRIAAGLPIGFEGAYFVGGGGFKGQGDDSSVTDGNNPPGAPTIAYNAATFGVDYQKQRQLRDVALTLGLAQPGLWCQWVPNEGGTAIEWDTGGKFYEYIEWIEYLIAHFLGPWGYTLNGEVEWQGEERDDRGLIVIVNNAVSIKRATITWA